MESRTRMIEDQAKHNFVRFHAMRNKSLGWDYALRLLVSRNPSDPFACSIRIGQIDQ
jgi:hypothetical protein